MKRSAQLYCEVRVIDNPIAAPEVTMLPFNGGALVPGTPIVLQCRNRDTQVRAAGKRKEKKIGEKTR